MTTPTCTITTTTSSTKSTSKSNNEKKEKNENSNSIRRIKIHQQNGTPRSMVNMRDVNDRAGDKTFSKSLSSLSPTKQRQNSSHLMSSKIISPKKGTTQNSPKNRRRGYRYFTSPKKQFKIMDKSQKINSPWSSTQGKQKRVQNNTNHVHHDTIKKNINYDPSAFDFKARSENTVVGKDSLDGIEISLKPHGMELLHVVGDSSRQQRLIHPNCDDRDSSSSTAKTTEEIMKHSTDVHWKGSHDENYSSLKYHAVCDFNTWVKKHRVPINRDQNGHDCGTEMKDELGYQGKLAILEKYPVLNEDRAVEEELLNLWQEMKAIEQDRKVILQEKYDVNNNMVYNEKQKWTKCAIWKCNKHWDIDEYLDGVNRKNLGFRNYAASISKENRKYLQSRRGEYLHAGFKVKGRVTKSSNGFHFKSTNILKVFATKCGGNPNSCRPHKALQDCRSFLDIFGIQLIATHASSVRNLAVLADEIGTSSFFVSKDDGRSYYNSYLPPRLMERWKSESLHDPDSCFGRLRYVSCGPCGSYYAELVSGQSFWSIGRHDEAFQLVMDKLHVHRIAFGSFELDSSWIVLSKEGHVVWRNIPLGLQKVLLSREPAQAAPCEISLGYQGSYFIRFLDGEIDYCLPSFMTEVVNRILWQGAEITSIIMNVDAPDAFIIRHTKFSSTTQAN